MGLDVTFHPVSVEDLQRFLFDVFEAPAVASRLPELTPNAALRELIIAEYAKFERWQEEDAPLEATYAMLAATLAGARHPYWYSRGDSLSGLASEDPGIDSLFVPFTKLAHGPFRDLPNPSAGRITENYTASDIVPAQALPQFAARLSDLADVLRETWDDENLASLHATVRYAREKGLGLMEVGDLVVPIVNEYGTEPENFRAAFIGQMDP